MKMKRLFAAVLSVVLLLCIAGCGQEKPEATTAPTVHGPEAAGVLFVSIGAEYKVVYDTDGGVIAVDGMDDTATEVLIPYHEATSSSCDTVVGELVKRTISAGKHPNTQVVVIKQAPDSQLPTDNFLDKVRTAATAASDYEVVLIASDALVEDGYISKDAAKDILTRQLKLTNVTINCADVLSDAYILTFEIDGAEQEYEINAVTGTVILESLPSDLTPDDGGQQDSEYYDPAGDPANDNFLDAPIEPEQ